MAVSRDRLDELISKGATIYRLFGKMRLNIHLDSSYYVSDAGILRHKVSEEEDNAVEHIEYLYETQKQADWALKYHATRTEELVLPYWTEFKKGANIKFFGTDTLCYVMYGYNRKIRLAILGEDGMEFEKQNWSATEENYEKACDLCLKLFLEEK